MLWVGREGGVVRKWSSGGGGGSAWRDAEQAEPGDR